MRIGIFLVLLCDEESATKARQIVTDTGMGQIWRKEHLAITGGLNSMLLEYITQQVNKHQIFSHNI